MNILTISYNSDFHYIRPDISLNKDSNDYFCPDGITEITVAPFMYIRIERAGKAISCKFAQRYYSAVGYGVNLTAASLIKSEIPQSFQTANSLDNTTYVSRLHSFEEFPTDLFENLSEERIKELFNIEIEKITRLTSVRTGDYIAIELAPHSPLPAGEPFKLGEIEFTIK